MWNDRFRTTPPVAVGNELSCALVAALSRRQHRTTDPKGSQRRRCRHDLPPTTAPIRLSPRAIRDSGIYTPASSRTSPLEVVFRHQTDRRTHSLLFVAGMLCGESELLAVELE